MRIPISTTALILAAGAVLVAVPQAPARLSPLEVAAALQKKYDAVRDFSADFVHNYEGGVLRKKLSERGTVQVKKPGRMRWDYKAPESKLFVSDGSRVYLYVPAGNPGLGRPGPEGGQGPTARVF